MRYWCCLDCRHCALDVGAHSHDESFEIAQSKYYGHEAFAVPAAHDLIGRDILSVRKKLFNLFLSGKRKILEVGPGNGQFMAWLISAGHEVTGVEHSAAQVASLPGHVSDRIIVGAFEVLPIEKGAYDAFCSFHVIEHVRDPEQHLVRAFEAVRPGGMGFVATPNAASWEQKYFVSLSPNFDSAHLFVFSPESLRLIAERAGWTVVHVSTPELVANWLRVATKLVRRLRQEDEEATAGMFARSSSPIMHWSVLVLKGLTKPLRWIQSKRLAGNEIFIVLQRPLD